MAPKIKALLYYKMTALEDAELLAEGMHAFCSHYNILGRILIGPEGLNGACAGPAESIEKYKEYVHSIPGLEDVWFKEHEVSGMPFHKLAVKFREEIVTLGVAGIDGSKATGHITPAEFNEMYEEGKKHNDLVVIDMRNDIEYQLGHFKDALNPGTQFFRELPQVIHKFEKYKDKKVVMYCTGGIRCEKASEYFRKEGFEQVYHIQGGIYNYCNQFPDGLFEGDCFVFDDRMQIGFKEGMKVEATQDKKSTKALTHCKYCSCKTNRVVNDERVGGRHLIVCCAECDKAHDISRVRPSSESIPAQDTSTQAI